MSEARIAVLVCSWATGDPALFDVSRLVREAERMPEVVLAAGVHHLCSDQGARKAVSLLKGSGADRFVVAACAPATKEPLHRRIAEEAGLHPLAFEVANVREGAAYVHAPQAAEAKAGALLSMAVARSSAWTPPPFDSVPLTHRSVAVVGDGLQAALAAGHLLALGLEVSLITSEGGLADPPACIFLDPGERQRATALMRKLASSGRIEMLVGSQVVGVEGVPGSMRLLLEDSAGARAVPCGAVLLAPEADLELRDLEGNPAPGTSELNVLGVGSVAILAGGKSSGTGCACITPRGISYALQAVRDCPGMRVSLLGREIRALGRMEEVQLQAQAQGVIFHRMESEPSVSGKGPYRIDLLDPLIGPVSTTADLVLVDSVSTIQAGLAATALGLPLDEKGEILRLESRLRPGETVRPGVFACRQRVGNMLLEDLALEAAAAAARAAELLRRGETEVGGGVAQVDEQRCSACLSCVRVCPYSAPRIAASGKAEVRWELCQGCGSCASLCPSRAIVMHRASDAQMLAQLKAWGRCGQ